MRFYSHRGLRHLLCWTQVIGGLNTTWDHGTGRFCRVNYTGSVSLAAEALLKKCPAGISPGDRNKQPNVCGLN